MKKLLLICLISALVSSAFGQALEIKGGLGSSSFPSLSNALEQFQSAYGVRFKSESGCQFSFGLNYRTNERWAFGTGLYFVNAEITASNNNRPFEKITSQDSFHECFSYTPPIQSLMIMVVAQHTVLKNENYRVEAKLGLGLSSNNTFDFFEANTRGEYVKPEALSLLGGSNAPRDFRFTQTGNDFTQLIGFEITNQNLIQQLTIFMEPCYVFQPFKRVQLTEYSYDSTRNNNLQEFRRISSFNLNNFQLNAGLKYILPTKSSRD